MMNDNFIYIRWDGEIHVIKHAPSELRQLEEEYINAWFTEYVVGNWGDVIIICDESGASKPSCPPNFKASLYYAGTAEGCFIHGDVILARAAGPIVGYTGFSDLELIQMLSFLQDGELELKCLLWNTVIGKDEYHASAQRTDFSLVQKRVEAKIKSSFFVNKEAETLGELITDAIEGAREIAAERAANEDPSEY